VDLGNCYGAVAHPIASIAVQAFGVSPIMVKVMLSVMQTMKFFLRSGYGDSTQPFGGSSEQPYGGLGQGSGAAPSLFSAVSTLMIMAFLQLGHGVQISTTVTGFVFTLAAILYVDDTDVLHRAKSPTMSDEEFFDQVQQATNDWANLAIATGGALKPKKCFWYLIAFRFCNGRAFYKMLSQLPRRHLTVPLPDGTSAPNPSQ
jgi:hypothetical protein